MRTSGTASGYTVVPGLYKRKGRPPLMGSPSHAMLLALARACRGRRPPRCRAMTTVAGRDPWTAQHGTVKQRNGAGYAGREREAGLPEADVELAPSLVAGQARGGSLGA